MKLTILLLLFTLNAQAAFIPMPETSKTVYGLPIMPKGALMSSSGISNGSSTICADTEILEWDSAEVDGVKCVAKPVVNYVLSPSTGTNISTASTSWVIRASAAITTTGNPVKVEIVTSILVPDSHGCYNYLQGTGDTSYISILRDGVVLSRHAASPATSTDQQEDATLSVVDIQPAGNYTYSIAHSTLTGAGTSFISNCSLLVQEIK